MKSYKKTKRLQYESAQAQHKHPNRSDFSLSLISFGRFDVATGFIFSSARLTDLIFASVVVTETLLRLGR